MYLLNAMWRFLSVQDANDCDRFVMSCARVITSWKIKKKEIFKRFATIIHMSWMPNLMFIPCIHEPFKDVLMGNSHFFP